MLSEQLHLDTGIQEVHSPYNCYFEIHTIPSFRGIISLYLPPIFYT